MTHPHLLPLLNPPRPGRTVYTVSEFWAEYEHATPSRRRHLLGLSPGGAAALLGISRQAVHRAIDRGTLRATYIHDDHTGELRSVTVDMDSLREYADRNRP